MIETFETLEDMYYDLGLREKVKIRYHLLGEVNSNEIVVRPIASGSEYDTPDLDFVNIGSGLLVDRDNFHGTDEVIIEDFDKVQS